MKVCGDVTSLLKLVEDGFSTYDVKDWLEYEAVDMRSKIGEQAETIAGLRHMREELKCDIGNVCLRLKGQTEPIGCFGSWGGDGSGEFSSPRGK